MNNFERRYGKFSISNLTQYIIIGRVICFILQMFHSEVIEMLTLNTGAILHGQVWRLITFLFIPTGSPLFFLFEILFLYWIGNALEEEWGSLRYTLYLLGGILGVTASILMGQIIGLPSEVLGVSSLFIYTLFLPFAWYYGEQELNIMFFFPVKVKYLAILDAILIIRIFASVPPIIWVVYGFSMINLLVFYIVVLVKRGKQRARLAGFQYQMRKVEKEKKKSALHKCAVCGVTEQDDPGMSFRYCSQCEGDYEFCEKHLRDHKHFKKVVEFKPPKDS